MRPAPSRSSGFTAIFGIFMAALALIATTALYRSLYSSAPPLSPRDRLESDALKSARSDPGDPALNTEFAEINRDHFQGALKSVRVVWSEPLRGVGPMIHDGFVLQGLTDGTVILLNPDLRDEPAEITRVLCHEMVHVSLIARGAARAEHGPAFQDILKRLADEHAFEGIQATAEERADTKTRLLDEARAIAVERDELDSLNSQLDTRSAELKAQSDDFNRRMAAANERQSGWPPAGEREAILQKQNDLNDDGAGFNERVRGFNERVRRFNDDTRRFNLMLVYPDGLDLENAVKEQTTHSGRQG